jgi:hypothetical protein
MWMSSGILLLENQNERVGNYSQRLLMSIECRTRATKSFDKKIGTGKLLRILSHIYYSYN